MSHRERGVRSFRGRCRANQPAFGVVQRILRARFEIRKEEDLESTRNAFRESVIKALGDHRVSEFLYFLGAYLDLHFDDSPFARALESEPSQFVRISRAVLREFFEVDARRQPLILTFEDLQWAQGDDLELVHYLISSFREAPILTICVAQPELIARWPNWTQSPHHHVIDVGPLSENDAATLMYKHLEPLAEVPEELVDVAVDIAKGSPYLLEQAMRVFLKAEHCKKKTTEVLLSILISWNRHSFR